VGLVAHQGLAGELQHHPREGRAARDGGGPRPLPRGGARGHTRGGRAAAAAPPAPRPGAELLAKPEEAEAPDGDVLAQAPGRLRPKLLDGARLFLPLVPDVLLVEEADGLQMLGQLALDGPLARVLRDVLGLRLVDRPLGGDVLLWDLVAAHEARL